MIEFDYDGVDEVIVELGNVSNSLTTEVENYLNIVNEISDSSRWISREKETVISMARGEYLKYISDNIENIDNLKAEVENKKNDFIDAENQIKGLSI